MGNARSQTRLVAETSADESPIDLAAFVKPGDSILWGQGTGEPQTLTEALVQQRHRLGGATVFLGTAFTSTLRPEHADALQFVALGGLGMNAALFKAGVLDVLPSHISTLPGLFASGRLRVDVVFIQVSPPDARGRHSLGLVADYLRPAMARARCVIAEVNERVPFTHGDTLVDADEIDQIVHSSREPVTVDPRPGGDVEAAIAERVAAMVPDGAVLQVGIGGVPDAIAASLVNKRDLGIHSGMVGDSVLDLIEAGAVTNARKPVDTGVTVAGVLFGTRRLYDFADDNPALQLRSLSYTHNPEVLRRFDSFFAINSAIEIDLTGQVNAETVGGRHVGAVGGQVDFVRAAMASPHGRSIIALPSTAKGGERSRIVVRTSDGVTTTARSDADVVVTEHGVADLRGIPIRARARRLIDIAHPRFRDELASQVGSLC